jgi:sugar phosphate isomerase/epimerase
VKFAFMSFSVPNDTLPQLLAKAVQHGYDGVELRLQSNHGHGVEITTSAEERHAIRAMLSKSKVEICCLASSLRFAVPQERQTTIQAAQEVIALAGDIGVPSIRAFGGAIPLGVTREQARDCAIASLLEVADMAADQGVAISMETHDSWSNPEDMRSIVERVNHPAVKVNWDFLHCVRLTSYSVRQGYEILKAWINHCHIHDAVLGSKDKNPASFQWVRMGDGAIDHREAIACLEADGFQGYMSGEWIGWDSDPDHLGKEIAVLRQIEQEVSL